MSVTIDREVSEPSPLEQELHELEAQEAALERRTRSLELAGPLGLIFSLFAMVFGIGGLVVALNKDGGSSSSSSGGAGAQSASMMNASAPSSGSPMASSGPSSSGQMVMGAGGHGRFTAMQMAAATRGTVYVQLGDYWAAPTVGSVHAGKVTFMARNVGRTFHELMVERMPIRYDGPQMPNEKAAQGMIDDMQPGQSGRVTMHLKPGKYMLFCNAPGHFAAGQHTVFTVKA